MSAQEKISFIEEAANDMQLQPITSPSNTDLSLRLFPSSEGLSEELDVDVFYGEMSLIDLDRQFDTEKNSSDLAEHLKMQRDVDSSRVNGISTYLKTRPDYTFPTLILFVNQLKTVAAHKIGQKTVIEAILESASHRFICDGQGRTYTIKQLLAELPALHRHGIGFKLINTKTNSIYDAEKVIKQVFADVNGKTKKPSTSLSLFFDSSQPFSRLMRELTTMTLSIDGSDVPLYQLLAKQGKVGKGQLWTYKQFSAFFCTLFGKTEGDLNKALADEDAYNDAVSVGRQLVKRVLQRLPLHLLSSKDWRHVHADSLFTKALFSKGLALTAKCLIAESLESDSSQTEPSPVDWSKLDALTTMPITDVTDPLWLKNGIMEDMDGTLRIVKRCENRIARVLCFKLRITPSLEI